MADYKVTDAQLSGIADAIRTKGGTSEPLAFPSAFVSAIQAIPSGITPSGSISISQNGTHDVSAFADAVVNVSGGGSNDNFLIFVGASAGSIYDTEASVVGYQAFSGKNNYRGYSISSLEMTAVKTIEDFGCQALQCSFVSFPECETIKNRAFAESSIPTVYFPKCITIQNSGAFAGARQLNSAIFPECVTIGQSAFVSCTSLSIVDFPKCTNIGSNAFSSCTALREINFPSCQTVNGSAFINCSITSADFPECTYIGGSAFYNCKQLSYANFPKCSSLDINCFRPCNKLEMINLNVCSNIKDGAFVGCNKLSVVNLLYSSICSLASSVFSSTPMQYSSYLGYFGSIYVPASLVDSYKVATNWSSIADRITAYVE